MKDISIPNLLCESEFTITIKKDNLENGSFSKFVSILDNNFVINDEKYKAIVK